MDPTPAPCAPHDGRASPVDTETKPDTPADVARPTHRVRNTRCGNNGMQLLVSTRDHVYDTDEVEAGEGTWQVIGTWSDESAPELTKLVNQRSHVSNSTRPSVQPQVSTQSHFEKTGKRLGTVGERGESVANGWK